ncbi:HD superfamily hydrolase, putative [Talaromyces stipitatus ATCC 10500]|uniref:HD superfamily hydrolase, putative n=1 Tax=Talaromyces stipitatus (strain ATCC 10500 / CBS 375.48 / QM 6759 / NRRL 1006) TaxID=441959 RepID=B8MHB7_TALSN|nr:HD superfamily hydrolase, putative [Talaromyces stipitatus ATCC 10500]EED17096.1 HD superfamily hydrolase, putative [Talaromyces stipitatus ATCC 10500]
MEPSQDECLITSMTNYMTTCMSGHDPSHNPTHVHRVVSLAHRILASELTLHPDTAPIKYNKTVITLAAILHDIGDHKYLPTDGSAADPKQLVYNALLSHGADEQLASRVQTIVNNVSYTNETRNPDQDADRLDAIGAVGIARTFTYLGSQGLKRAATADSGPWELEDSITHFGEKLERLEGMMKTDTGMQIARERTRRLKLFKEWWVDETAPFDS